MERIESLRKDKLLKTNFESAGLEPDFYDLKFVINDNDSEYDYFQIFIDSIIKKYKDFVFSSSVSDLQDFLKKINNDFVSIDLFEFTSLDLGYEDYMARLIGHCAGVKTGANNIKKNYNLFELTFKKNGKETKGFSINAKIRKNFHFTSRKFTRSGYDYKYMLDLNRLIGETFAYKSIEHFVRKNKSIVQYLVAKEIIKRYSYKHKFAIPSDKAFQKEFLKVAQERKLLIPDKSLWEEDNYVNNYKEIFMLNEIGGVINAAYDNRLIRIVLPKMASEINKAIVKTNCEMSTNTKRAKAFETKEYINKKTQKKMINNVFIELKKFGYVELDNEVDLKTFEKIEKEFVEFTKIVFVPSALDHSFRIKKLGRHRAAGIYFPYQKATIFDIDHPDAFAHELAHQIDYTMNDNDRLISEDVNFVHIYDMYKDLTMELVSKLPESDEFKKMWEGKSKFNHKYYLQNTEVFARCFELYLVAKNVKTSFIKDNYDSPVYPKNETFLNNVIEYFDELFAELSKDNKKIS